MATSVEAARIYPDAPDEPTLFPPSIATESRATPRELCRRIGLSWLAATTLFEKGFLSFDPEKTESINRAQSAELSFLGALVVADCSHSMLEQLLKGLTKPYAYRLDMIYYDWLLREWKMQMTEATARRHIGAWLDELVERCDAPQLRSLRDSVDAAIMQLRLYVGRW